MKSKLVLTPPCARSLLAHRALVLSTGLWLTACGGGADVSPPGEQSTSGRAFRAKEGAVVVELDTAGNALQRSLPTDSVGNFAFLRPVKGARVEVARRASVLRPAAVRSARMRGGDAGVIEITPLTTLYDQLLSAGDTPAKAVDVVSSLVTRNCGVDAGAAATSGLFADSQLRGASRDWLLRALDAYINAFRNVGLSPDTPGMDWAAKLEQHEALLSQMCKMAEFTFSTAWLADAQRAVSSRLNVTAANALDTVKAARPHAVDEVLELMGRRLVEFEFPELTLAARVAGPRWIGKEPDLVLQLIEAELRSRPASPGSTPEAVTSLQAGAGFSLDRRGRIVQTLWQQAAPAGSSAAILHIENRSDGDRQVRLRLNDVTLSDLDGTLEQVLALPALRADEPVWQRAWRFVVSMRRHGEPITDGWFMHQPDLFIRSIGVGYCDDVASLLHWIWRGLGYEARVMALSGHVVPEVRVGDEWEMYDPDFGVFYLKDDASVASVADIEKDTSLISAPRLPAINAYADDIRDLLVSIYGSADNNYVAMDLSTPTPLPLSGALTIPTGGTVEIRQSDEISMPTFTAGTDELLGRLRLWIPPGYSGTLELPLVLADVAGAGRVAVNGRTFDVTPAGLAPDIVAYYRSGPSVGITQLRLDEVGPGGITLTLLLNPKLLQTHDALLGVAYGTDLSGLTMGNTTSMR